MKKVAVLLVNLGTPDSPDKAKVGVYLKEFLNDPRVIDLPTVKRKLLVNGIIVPFRKGKSAKEYAKLWTKEGSPLLLHTVSLTEKVQAAVGDKASVSFAMRYQHPSMASELEKIRKSNPDKIIIIPLYPQYASASTGSTMEEAMRIMKDWWVIPEVTIVSQFYDHPTLIRAYAEIARPFVEGDCDHILFSYHGLPQRQLDKVYDEGACKDHSCDQGVNDDNKFCYKATCYETTKLITEALNIPADKYTVCFQSRLDDEWVKPYTDVVLKEKAAEGVKKLVVLSPAFTADCLETIVEIGMEYNEMFKEYGGEKLTMVPSLNDHPLWVQTVKEMIEERL